MAYESQIYDRLTEAEQLSLNDRVTNAIATVENEHLERVQAKKKLEQQLIVDRDVEIEEENDSFGDGMHHISTSLNNTEQEEMLLND